MLDFKSALGLDSNDSKVYYYIGKTHLDLKNIQESINFFSKAIQINPKDDISYSTRGYIYFNHFDEYELAKADFKASLRISPKNVNTNYNLSLVCAMTGDYKTAIKYSTDAINLVAEGESDCNCLSEIYEWTGRMYTALKDFEIAEEYLIEAIKIDSNNVEYHILLGDIYKIDALYYLSYSSYTKAIQLDSLCAEAYTSRAYLNWYNDWDSVVDDLTIGVNLIHFDSLKNYHSNNLSIAYFQKSRTFYDLGVMIGAHEDVLNALSKAVEYSNDTSSFKYYDIIKFKKKLHINYCKDIVNLNWFTDSRYCSDCIDTNNINFPQLKQGLNILYYSKDETRCLKKNAFYSRHINLDEKLNPIGEVKDYYKNNKLKMQADSFISFYPYNSNIFEVFGDYFEYDKRGKLTYECFFGGKFPQFELYH